MKRIKRFFREYPQSAYECDKVRYTAGALFWLGFGFFLGAALFSGWHLLQRAVG